MNCFKVHLRNVDTYPPEYIMSILKTIIWLVTLLIFWIQKIVLTLYCRVVNVTLFFCLFYPHILLVLISFVYFRLCLCVFVCGVTICLLCQKLNSCVLLRGIWFLKSLICFPLFPFLLSSAAFYRCFTARNRPIGENKTLTCRVLWCK